MDKVAGGVITAGGVAVLAAMLGICVFLVATAWPLVDSGRVVSSQRSEAGGGDAAGRVGRGGGVVVADGLRAVFVGAGGIVLLDPATGAEAARLAVPEGTAFAARMAGTGDVVVAGAGGVGLGRVSVRSVPVADAAGGFAGLASGQSRTLNAAEVGRLGMGAAEAERGHVVLERVEGGGLRAWVIGSEFGELSQPGFAAEGEQIAAGASARAGNARGMIAVVGSRGSVAVAGVRQVRRLDGGEGPSERVTWEDVGASYAGDGPRWVHADAAAGSVLLVWEDGRFARLERAEGRRGAWGEVEAGRLTEAGVGVTAFAGLLGGRTALVGDAGGVVTAWTVVPGFGGEGGTRLARVRAVEVGEGAVGVIAPADRSRVWAARTADGAVVVRSATSGKLVAELARGGGGVGGGDDGQGVGLAIDGGGERVVALDPDAGALVWGIAPGHPDVSVRALFGPVQYEGREKPLLVYQSTGGDGAEPKYSLVPLVWGTVKATVVAMLIAVPLAVLAAVYTSEFLSPGSRRRVKPAIELMASLPSVVLGFIAAAVVAPFVRDELAACVVGLATVPAAVMLGAGVWQVVPERWRRRVRGARLAGLIALACVAGALAAVAAGATVERWLFGAGGAEGGGGVRAWLDVAKGSREAGSAWGGWVCVLMPAAAAVVWVVNTRVVSRAWNGWVDGMSVGRAAWWELARVAGLLVMTAVVAALGAWGVTAAGWDARDSVLGTFSQRNTLVVGVVMGVAVIPIIFTIAEDALQAVPSGLRSASLGCGATAWQTAVRVVVPVAGSGIFSACMVGLGRAVGETMIVLMATGNTPEMDLNVFAGFRSLAANIAVELPEAPRGGTHYRVLFLCGLVLFVLTLVINTTAEVIRQRFRKRSGAL